MAAAVLGTGLWARAQGWSEGLLQTQMFVSLIIVHLLMAYVSRSTPHAFSKGWWRDRGLLAAILGSLALQGIVFAVPGLRSALGLEVLPAVGWLVAVTAAAAVIGVIEAVRSFRRPRTV